MIAHCVVVFHIALTVIVWGKSAYSQEHHNSSIENNHSSGSKTSNEWAIPVRVLSPPANPKEYSAYAEDHKKQERRDEENLAVQSSIAQSSKEISHYTSLQLWLACFSLVFVLCTLATAIAAAVFARRSAEAAHKTVDITRKLGEAQTRAYVFVKEAAMNWFSDGAQGVLTIINSGATPAKHFSVHGVMDFQENGAKVKIPHPTDAVTWSALGSGDTKTVPIDINGIHRHTLKSDQSNYLSVRGTIIYTSIFDEVFHTQFSFMMRYNPSEYKKLFNAASKLKVFELIQ